MDGTIEFGFIGEGLMRKVVRFEVAPGALDLVELGRVLRQPLDGEPVRSAGYCVDEAATYPDGERQLMSGHYELLISDAMLPGGNGISLIASAKAKGTKALLVTGHPGPMQIMTARGDPYLAKPFTPAALVTAINQLGDGD